MHRPCLLPEATPLTEDTWESPDLGPSGDVFQQWVSFIYSFRDVSLDRLWNSAGDSPVLEGRTGRSHRQRGSVQRWQLRRHRWARRLPGGGGPEPWAPDP